MLDAKKRPKFMDFGVDGFQGWETLEEVLQAFELPWLEPVAAAAQSGKVASVML